MRNHLLSLFEAADARPRPDRRRRAQPGDRGRRTDRGRGGRGHGRAGRQGAAPGLPRPRRACAPGWCSSSRPPTCWRRSARRAGATPARSSRRGASRSASTPPSPPSAADHVEFADGTRPAPPGWWCGRPASGRRLLADDVEATQGRGGRITVADDLSIPGHPDAFAVGDMADIDDGHGRPAARSWPRWRSRAATTPPSRCWPPSPAGPASRSTTSTRARWPPSGAGRRWPSCPAGSSSPARVAWFAWLGLHLVYLLGVRNRVSVFINWAWNYFTWDRGPRLILRPEVLPHTPHPLSDARGPAARTPATSRLGRTDRSHPARRHVPRQHPGEPHGRHRRADQRHHRRATSPSSAPVTGPATSSLFAAGRHGRGPGRQRRGRRRRAASAPSGTACGPWPRDRAAAHR